MGEDIYSLIPRSPLYTPQPPILLHMQEYLEGRLESLTKEADSIKRGNEALTKERNALDANIRRLGEKLKADPHRPSAAQVGLREDRVRQRPGSRSSLMCNSVRSRRHRRNMDSYATAERRGPRNLARAEQDRPQLRVRRAHVHNPQGKEVQPDARLGIKSNQTFWCN